MMHPHSDPRHPQHYRYLAHIQEHGRAPEFPPQRRGSNTDFNNAGQRGGFGGGNGGGGGGGGGGGPQQMQRRNSQQGGGFGGNGQGYGQGQGQGQGQGNQGPGNKFANITCSSCNATKPAGQFSKKQRSKPANTRCCSQCSKTKQESNVQAAVTGNPFADQAKKRGRDNSASVPITSAPADSAEEPLWKRIERSSKKQ